MDDALGAGRRRAGVALALLVPAAATAALSPLRDQVALSSDALLFVLGTVVVSLVGGLLPALVAAVVGSMLLNYFLTPPVHTLAIRDGSDAVTLFVFVVVAVLVSSVVTLAARRTRDVAEARADLVANRTRSALLAAVGHDLRTPLAAAKASVSSLRGTDVSLGEDDRRELLAAADESLDRLAGLVEDLLDLSRLRAGAMPVLLEPTPLADVVSRALDDVAAHGTVLDVDLPAELPEALADPVLLERVVVNLVGNALRHAVSVGIVGRRVGSRVELLVVDHGPGIPAADRERVFEPFQRLGDTDNTSGVGLGLALSRGLTEGMAGTLTASETPGGGVTMTVSLPAAAPTSPQPGRRERAAS